LIVDVATRCLEIVFPLVPGHSSFASCQSILRKYVFFFAIFDLTISRVRFHQFVGSLTTMRCSFEVCMHLDAQSNSHVCAAVLTGASTTTKTSNRWIWKLQLHQRMLNENESINGMQYHFWSYVLFIFFMLNFFSILQKLVGCWVTVPPAQWGWSQYNVCTNKYLLSRNFNCDFGCCFGGLLRNTYFRTPLRKLVALHW